jgi:hypothetical protein
MHEAVLARAALPAPTVCLGLLLRPFSLGHLLWLTREDLLALATDPGTQTSASPSPISQLPAAVLICCQTWEENLAQRRDWLLPIKLWLWRRRVAKESKPQNTLTTQKKETDPLPRIPRIPRFENPYWEQELAKFRGYLLEGALEFPLSDIPRPDGVSATRFPGTPFVLRLQQWLMTALKLSEAAAWDYPFGLAKMRWAAHWEEEGGLDIYGERDAQHDAFVSKMEALRKQRGSSPMTDH